MNSNLAAVAYRHKSSSDCYFEHLPDGPKQVVIEMLRKMHDAEGEKAIVRLSSVSKGMHAAVSDSGFLKNAELIFKIYNDKTPHSDDYAEHSDPSVRKASEIKQLKWIQNGDIKPRELISMDYTWHPNSRIREAGLAKLEQHIRSGDLNPADRYTIQLMLDVYGSLYSKRKEEPDTLLNRLISVEPDHHLDQRIKDALSESESKYPRFV